MGGLFELSEVSPNGEVCLFQDQLTLRKVVLIFREVGITFVGFVDVCDYEVRHQRHEEFVNLSTANDKNLLIDKRMILDISGVMDDFNSIVMPSGVSGENNVFAFRKRPTNRFKGLSPHEDRVPHGVPFKEL